MTHILPKEQKLTEALLDKINFKNVLYGERTQTGGMGNAGGIILYVLNGDKYTRYDTNVFTDEPTALAAHTAIVKNESLFSLVIGGMGNGVLVNKIVPLMIDEDGQCFWYEHDGNKYRIESSVKGVYNNVVKWLLGDETRSVDPIQSGWEESLRKRLSDEKD